jgi:glucan phosphoethanolaminetransferase (alkaline phosphatase superfamily)
MLQWILIALVVAGLVVDAVVHYDLASAFKHNKTSVLSEPTIFRIQATVSLLAALAVLARPRRYTAAFAFLVGASAFVAVVIYRYVNVGKLGPLPNMYDPYWAPAGKNLSAIGEAVAALAAAVLFAMLSAATGGIRARRADLSRSQRRGLAT